MTATIRIDRRILAGALLIAGLVTGLAIRNSISTSRTEPVSEAEQAYRKGDWPNATKLANDRLKSARNDTEALRILARSMARQGKDDLATAIYENRVKVDGMQSEDRFLLGQMIARQGNADLALGVWTKALAADPDHAEMREAHASLSAQKLRFEEAAQSAGELSRLPGKAALGRLMSGIFKASMDDPAGSVDDLRKAFEIDPAVSTKLLPPERVARLFANNLLRIGEPSEATKVLGGIRSAEQSIDPETAWLLARAELNLGKANPESELQKKAMEFREANPLELEPAPFAGEKRCAECHEDISASYAQSRHANSFRHGAELSKLPLPETPLQDPDDPQVKHAFERKNDRVEIVTKRGDEEILRVLAEFAFGTPDRYFTLVGQDSKGQFRASRLSRYHGKNGTGWDRTSGDTGSDDESNGALGQTVHTREGIVRCLACHVTSPRDFRKNADRKTAAAEDKGLGCESCHGPGSNHVIAAKAEFPDPAIRSLTHVDGYGIDKVCVDCHTVGDPSEIRASPDDPKWVRSAGVTFSFSRCFTQSRGKLSCVTCHDPHASSKPNVLSIESKCVRCHSKPDAASKSAVDEFRAETVCKAGETKNCVQCHMPKIEVPVLHDSLTDHYIRVRK